MRERWRVKGTRFCRVGCYTFYQVDFDYFCFEPTFYNYSSVIYTSFLCHVYLLHPQVGIPRRWEMQISCFTTRTLLRAISLAGIPQLRPISTRCSNKPGPSPQTSLVGTRPLSPLVSLLVSPVVCLQIISRVNHHDHP